MKVIVTGCANCPFVRMGAKPGCRINDAVKMDAVPESGVSDGCKLALGPTQVMLAIHTRDEATGYIEAFVGNRIKTGAGSAGVVVAKYRNAAQAGIADPKPEDADRYWYRVLLDNGDYIKVAQFAVTEITRSRGGSANDAEFEFHFGY